MPFLGEDLHTTSFDTSSPINKERITGQNKTLFEYLSEGNTITSLKAIKKFGITRLASRIWDLKKKGNVLIHDRMIEEGGINVKEYSMRPFPQHLTPCQG